MVTRMMHTPIGSGGFALPLISGMTIFFLVLLLWSDGLSRVIVQSMTIMTTGARATDLSSAGCGIPSVCDVGLTASGAVVVTWRSGCNKQGNTSAISNRRGGQSLCF